MKEINYKCSLCGYEYIETLEDSINVDNNPELRDEVLSAMTFIHVCPKCNNKNFIPQSMIYSCFKSGFISYLGDLYDCYKSYDAFVNVSDLMSIKEDNLRYSFATTFFDFRTNIIALENNIDPKALRLFFVILRNKILNNYKDDIKNIDSMYLEYNDNDLVICLEVSNDDIRMIPFDFNYYNSMLNELYEVLDGNNALYLDLELAEDLLFNKRGNFYVDDNYYDVGLIDYKGIATRVYIPSLLNGMVEVGDEVVIYSNTEVYTAVLLNIRHGHLLDFSANLLGFPTVISKKSDSLVNTLDVVIDNTPLIDALKLYKEKNERDYRPDDLMNNTFVFVKFDGDKIVLNSGYLSLFTKNSGDLKCASLDNIIRMVLNDPNTYKGIRFEEIDLSLDNLSLMDYRESVFFSYNEKMSNLIGLLTDSEKLYLGDVYLDIIYSIDGRISKEEALKKHNLSLDDFNYLSNTAIRKLRNIIFIDY